MKDIKIGFFSDTHTLHKEWKNKFSETEGGKELEKQWSDLDILLKEREQTKEPVNTYFCR